MLDLLDALGAAGCAACDRHAVAGGADPLAARLCEACRAEVPSTVAPVAAPACVTVAWSLAPYAGPLGALLRVTKYGGNDAVLGAVARAVAHGAAAAGLGGYDAVVPVPTTLWRRLVRGFNTADRIGFAVSGAVDAPLVDALVRRGGAAQAGRARRERAHNVRATYRAAPSGIAGPLGHVLLVDDVLTTGATASACAAELLGAGATRVDLLVAASSATRIAQS
jgi:predicted amidophosphoribosyltransferase